MKSSCWAFFVEITDLLLFRAGFESRGTGKWVWEGQAKVCRRGRQDLSPRSRPGLPGRGICGRQVRRCTAMSADLSKKGAWTPEEDDLLVKLVTTHGPKNWSTAIAAAIPGRSGKSCRLR